MATKAVYWSALLLFLSAWLTEANIKISEKLDAVQSPAKVVEIQMSTDLSVFGVDATKLEIGGDCNLEAINSENFKSEPVQIGSEKIKLTGWAMDKIGKHLPKQVLLRISAIGRSDLFVAGSIGFNREDVRGYFSLPNQVLASGTKIEIPLGSISPGLYDLTLVLQYDDIVYVCDNGRKLEKL